MQKQLVVGFALITGMVTATRPIAAQAAQTPTVTVSGVGYVHYYYQLKTDSSLTPPAHGNNFDVARSHVDVLGKFSGGISTRVTVDVDGRKAASNQQTIRLKYAYVAWTPEHSHLTYKIGAIHTPLIDWEESLWGYRMQGTVPLDRLGYVTSSDFGVGVDGTWNQEQVNAQVGVYNGEGYSNAPGDNRKDISGRVSVRLARTDAAGKAGGLRLTGYANLGYATGGATRNRFLGILSYQSTAVTLAAEYGMTKDSTSAATPDAKGRLVAAYGVFKVPHSKVAIIGRIDSFDPNIDSTAVTPAARLAVNRQTRVIAGVSYAMTPNLRLLADADLNSVAGGSPNNSFDRGRQLLYLHTEFKF
ncbi:MAG: hypothetical protein ABJC19_04285 [Gemmatimonadota bacterium]